MVWSYMLKVLRQTAYSPGPKRNHPVSGAFASPDEQDPAFQIRIVRLQAKKLPQADTGRMNYPGASPGVSTSKFKTMDHFQKS